MFGLADDGVGKPGPDGLALLEPFRDKVPAGVRRAVSCRRFRMAPAPTALLRREAALLQEAGFVIGTASLARRSAHHREF
jgi:hypothetical protein